MMEDEYVFIFLPHKVKKEKNIPCICTNKIRKKQQKKFPLYRRAQESFFVHWRIHPDNVYVDLRYNKYSCFLG